MHDVVVIFPRKSLKTSRKTAGTSETFAETEMTPLNL